MKKYDAFISYRHLKLDEWTAKKIQFMLEGYRPPRGIADGKKIGRIFRDTTELPTSKDLSMAIKDALASSEYLIIILTEYTRASDWCMEEIRTFKELNGGSINNILPVIASGDPKFVIPEELRSYEKTEIDENGAVTRRTEEWEPICADIRAKSRVKRWWKLQSEYLRIAAPMLNCGYDDLYQRNKKRKRRRILAFALLAIIILALFALLQILHNQTRLNNLAERSLQYQTSALKAEQNEDWLEMLRAEKAVVDIGQKQVDRDVALTNIFYLLQTQVVPIVTERKPFEAYNRMFEKSMKIYKKLDRKTGYCFINTGATYPDRFGCSAFGDHRELIIDSNAKIVREFDPAFDYLYNFAYSNIEVPNQRILWVYFDTNTKNRLLLYRPDTDKMLLVPVRDGTVPSRIGLHSVWSPDYSNCAFCSVDCFYWIVIDEAFEKYTVKEMELNSLVEGIQESGFPFVCDGFCVSKEANAAFFSFSCTDKENILVCLDLVSLEHEVIATGRGNMLELVSDNFGQYVAEISCFTDGSTFAYVYNLNGEMLLESEISDVGTVDILFSSDGRFFLTKNGRSISIFNTEDWTQACLPFDRNSTIWIQDVKMDENAIITFETYGEESAWYDLVTVRLARFYAERGGQTLAEEFEAHKPKEIEENTFLFHTGVTIRVLNSDPKEDGEFNTVNTTIELLADNGAVGDVVNQNNVIEIFHDTYGNINILYCDDEDVYALSYLVNPRHNKYKKNYNICLGEKKSFWNYVWFFEGNGVVSVGSSFSMYYPKETHRFFISDLEFHDQSDYASIIDQGHLIIVYDEENVIEIWDYENNNKLFSITPINSIYHSDTIPPLEVMVDGRIRFETEDGMLYLLPVPNEPDILAKKAISAIIGVNCDKEGNWRENTDAFTGELGSWSNLLFTYVQ